MFRHYLKIAFRNLWKYKNQTLVSVVGLAVGFACFAIATLWIRYEMTYDSFHKNADRIYCVYLPSVFYPTGVSREGPSPLAGHLKATFPEIAHSTTLLPTRLTKEMLTVDGIVYDSDVLRIDSSFFNMFDVKIIEGSMNFLIPENKNVAITVEKAKQLFGDDSPVGKTVKLDVRDEYTVGAVVTSLPKRSNYPFDFLEPMRISTNWNVSSGEHTLIELFPDVDVEAFRKKLYEHEVRGRTNMTVMPLTTVRYEDPNIFRDVKFQHIIIFSIAGSLVILCTLFNYLTLFISRFRIRQRELALRIVCGASNRSLFTLLSVEFLVSLFIALILGLFIIFLVIEPFRELSNVRLELSSIYVESLVYIAGIIAISLTAFILTLAIFRRRTLNTNIRRNNKLFRRVSIALQLVISIGFTFCTVIILKQMYHLHNTDLGFTFKNHGSVALYGERRNEIDISILEDKMKQMPEITETITGCSPLIPVMGRGSYRVNNWDGKTGDAQPMNIEECQVTEQFMSHYEMRIIKGELLSDNDDPKYVLINESAAKMFGWDNAVGKSFNAFNDYIIKGVIANIYNMAPTIAAQPMFYKHIDGGRNSTTILFKYNEGAWQSCKKKIEEIIAQEYPGVLFTKIYNAEEEFDKFLKSENTLLRILTLVSLVCVIVCIFGFVSMVSLTCEERRKEIAVRKIHGATIKDILDIFFKEYLTLLAIGTLIAFPVGYIIMKRWLENYVVQTEISAWIYLSILLALIMVIVVCVGGKVLKTSRENPAEAVKS